MVKSCMCSSSKHGDIKRKCLIFYTYVFKNPCMPSKNSFWKRIGGFKVVSCHLTRVTDATSNIKVTTILMSAHLSNTPNKRSKAYQSMDDLSTLLTPTRSSSGSDWCRALRFKGENKTSAILEIRPN